MADVMKTGNRKCWHVVDATTGRVMESRLTRARAETIAADRAHGVYGCRDGYKFIPCDGEAHNRPADFDNCGRCAPRWGWLMVKAES